MKSRWISFVLIVVGCVFLSGCLEAEITSTEQPTLTPTATPTATSTSAATSTSTPTTQKTYIVMATAERVDADTVRVTYQGGQDSDQVADMSLFVAKERRGRYMCGEELPNEIGSAVIIDCPIPDIVSTDKLYVEVTAAFKDGTIQVILSTYV